VCRIIDCHLDPGLSGGLIENRGDSGNVAGKCFRWKRICCQCNGLADVQPRIILFRYENDAGDGIQFHNGQQGVIGRYPVAFIDVPLCHNPLFVTTGPVCGDPGISKLDVCGLQNRFGPGQPGLGHIHSGLFLQLGG